MAMVFKSKKETSEIIKKDLYHPGPGDYIPLKLINNKSITNQKFSSTGRENFYPRNFNPGPGQYFQKEKPQIKKKEKKPNKDPKPKLSFEKIQELFHDTDTNDKIPEEKLGFNIKAIRFISSKEKIEQPGPGQYFPEINKFYKTNLVNKIKYNYKPRKINKNKAKYKLIPSIPSKEQKYGFNILEDGNLVPKKAPNFYQTFTGVKGDTVGPGSYEMDKSNELYKTRPKWTISRDTKSTFSLLSTNLSDNSRFLDSSNLLSSITANKFFFDDNLKIKELTPYNISSNSFASHSNSKYFNNMNKSDNDYELIEKLKKKDFNFKRIPLSYTSSGFFNKDKEKKENRKKTSRLTFKINTNPGPGFYIDRFKNSSFNCKSVPESYQFFGSNSKRFNYKNILKDERDTINSADGREEIKGKKIKQLITPFSTSEEKLKPPYILIEKSTMPSPAEYFPQKIKKIKSFSNFMKFGSNAKRFIEKKEVKWKKEVPGPGTYNPEKIKSHINTRKMIKTQDYNNKYDIYIDRLNYKIKTIEFENYKKSSLTNLKVATFYRTNPTLKESNSCKNLNPPPGLYYVDKLYKPKQIIPPFNSSSNKQLVLFPSKTINVGPGQYKNDSYFDWNKKTFNITFN